MNIAKAIPATATVPKVADVAIIATLELFSFGSSFSAGKTVTMIESVLPFVDFTEISAVPSLTAVIFPFSTVATAVLLLSQVSVLSSAFSGFTVAVTVFSSPTLSSISSLSISTLVTSVFGASVDKNLSSTLSTLTGMKALTLKNCSQIFCLPVTAS